MSESLKTELLVICNNLGYVDDQKKYKKDPDCISCLKDLLRYLRRDDRKFSVRRILGTTKIVITDLMPLMKQHCVEDETLFDVALRLMLNLTNPALILFKEEIPDTVDGRQLYLEILGHLYEYKVAMSTDVKFFGVLAKHVTRILELDQDKRHEEHNVMLERILVLIRNILHVPTDASLEKVTDEDKNLHDRCLEVMQTSGWLDLLLYMANDADCRRYNFHLLEIISLMLREQNAEYLARSVDPNVLDHSINRRNYFERQRDNENLKELAFVDKRRNKVNSCLSNRFKEATYVVKNLKSISNEDYICHRTPGSINDITFDNSKKRVKKPKNRAPMQDESCGTIAFSETHKHRSTPLIRKYLYDFCKGFIADSYSFFMAEVRRDLSSTQSLSNDDTYYLWASQFFMEFNRCSKGDINSVLVTLSIEAFHFLHTQIQRFMESLTLEKKKYHNWSRRLHYALKAYKELLYSVAVLDTTAKADLRERAHEIKKVVFYEVDYRELVLELLGNFNPIKLSMNYLKDLVETNHLFLKLLEHYLRSSGKVIVAQRKRNVRRRKKKEKVEVNTDQPEVVWTEILEEVSLCVNGGLEVPTVEECPDVLPFDGASDKPRDEQKIEAMCRVHILLSSKKSKEAVALYRNAREAWLEDGDNAFGHPEITAEEEIANLNLILLDDILRQRAAEAERDVDEDEQKNAFDDSESRSTIKEQELEFNDFIKKYIHPRMIIPYCTLLSQFDRNSSATNKCVIRFLHRVAVKQKMYCILFQLSVFRSFQKILNCPAKDNEDIHEYHRFIKFIMSKFVGVAKKNSKILVELLFWKSSREAYEMEEGYGSFEASKAKTRRKPKADPESFADTIEDVISRMKASSDEEDNEAEPSENPNSSFQEGFEHSINTKTYEHEMLKHNLEVSDSDADSEDEAHRKSRVEAPDDDEQSTKSFVEDDSDAEDKTKLVTEPGQSNDNVNLASSASRKEQGVECHASGKHTALLQSFVKQKRSKVLRMLDSDDENDQDEPMGNLYAKDAVDDTEKVPRVLDDDEESTSSFNDRLEIDLDREDEGGDQQKLQNVRTDFSHLDAEISKHHDNRDEAESKKVLDRVDDENEKENDDNNVFSLTNRTKRKRAQISESDEDNLEPSVGSAAIDPAEDLPAINSIKRRSRIQTYFGDEDED